MVAVKTGFIEQLMDILGENKVLTSKVDLLCYSRDASQIVGMPEVVVLPSSTEEVSKILSLASQSRIPVVPRGSGTCLSGGAVPIKGGIVVDLSHMNKILEIDMENFQVFVEPGVVHADLNRELSKYGLFFPPDPASQDVCTIGGCLANNAGGPRAVKYGVTRDWVLGMEVVLPSGEILWTGSQTRKCVSFYDLSRLFIGSEGTLGIITKALLKVTPLPETRLSSIAFFKDAKQAARCVYEIIGKGLDPSACEFMDEQVLRAVSNFRNDFNYVGKAMILVELDGEKNYVQQRLKKLKEIFEQFNALRYNLAEDEKNTLQLWEIRKSSAPSLTSLGKPTCIIEDVTVPISKLPDLVEAIENVSKKYDILIGTLGHAGDGNLHPNLLFDERYPEEVERAKKAAREIMNEAIKLGGTLTGEHGIGVSKLDMVPLEHSTVEMELALKIKRAIDPYGIMNPGKKYPISITHDPH
ncbi:MAG: FAD-binding oxidoreductase [Candidatus Hodarchaeota archaeon]